MRRSDVNVTVNIIRTDTLIERQGMQRSSNCAPTGSFFHRLCLRHVSSVVGSKSCWHWDALRMTVHLLLRMIRDALRIMLDY